MIVYAPPWWGGISKEKRMSNEIERGIQEEHGQVQHAREPEVVYIKDPDKDCFRPESDRLLVLGTKRAEHDGGKNGTIPMHEEIKQFTLRNHTGSELVFENRIERLLDADGTEISSTTHKIIPFLEMPDSIPNNDAVKIGV